jgi:hypothetical protein
LDSVAVGGRCPFGRNRCALRSIHRLPQRPRIVNRNRSDLRGRQTATVACQSYLIGTGLQIAKSALPCASAFCCSLSQWIIRPQTSRILSPSAPFPRTHKYQRLLQGKADGGRHRYLSPAWTDFMMYSRVLCLPSPPSQESRRRAKMDESMNIHIP